MAFPKYPFAILSLAALALGSAGIFPVSAAVLPTTAITSTVYIGRFEGDQFTGRASGVIITPSGDVATNKHVIEDDFGYSTADLMVVPTGDDEQLDFACVWSPTRYVGHDRFDVAVLIKPAKLPCKVSYLSPVDDLAPTGTEIRVLGFPGLSIDIGDILPTSITSTRGQIAGRIVEGDDTPFLKTDAKIIPGNSGGPVIDDRNRLIGLAAARTTTAVIDEETIRLIVPAKHINAIFSANVSRQGGSGELPPDVDSGAWYAEAIGRFVRQGPLSASVPFRPADRATRAEFIELLIGARGGVSGSYRTASFADVPTSSPHFAAFEEAASKGWVRGSGDCYGRSPCYAKPGDQVNRAEAAALLNRAFGLSRLDQAPSFSDNAANAWYHDAVRIAADHCILKGDAGKGTVRPSDPMNRAEMAAMVARASEGLTYRDGCGEGRSTSAPAKGSQTKVVSFRRTCKKWSPGVGLAGWPEDVEGFSTAVTGSRRMLGEGGRQRFSG